MKNIQTLLATALLALSLGCASTADAQIRLLDDQRFITKHVEMGTPEEAVSKLIGPPEQRVEAGCQVPLFVEDTVLPVPGDAWLYQKTGDKEQHQLVLCFVDGYVVGQEKNYTGVKAGVMYSASEQVVDMNLVERILKGELNEQSDDERRIPRGGREFEI